VWEPDWAVRLRVKSSTMAMLGEEQQGARGGRSSRSASPSGGSPTAPAGQDSTAPAAPASPTIGDVINPANVLKGLFGR
jgi:hypothetical protein